MAKSDTALARFNEGITCPASVFPAFAEDIGLDEKIATKIGCRFGVGISRTGNSCVPKLSLQRGCPQRRGRRHYRYSHQGSLKKTG